MPSAERLRPHEPRPSEAGQGYLRQVMSRTCGKEWESVVVQLGLCPRPRDLSLWCQSRRGKGVGRCVTAPISDLGPWDGARVASQQSPILRPGQLHCTSRRGYRPERWRESTTNEDSSAVVRSERLSSRSRSLPEEPTRGATVDAATEAQSNGLSRPARASEWSGPYGEEFASDKSASATTGQSRSPAR
jgi:hypothetical protein